MGDRVNLSLARGSSPRGRGTRREGRTARGVRRFIPARAGNATRRYPALSSDPVHPRAGGERRPLRDPQGRVAGSSPRGRGTPASSELRAAQIRFIPARAGNAPLGAPIIRFHAVHPRAGGERLALPFDLEPESGSSPRGRGTPGGRGRRNRRLRFIPARAGNASARASSTRCCTVHPRAGGERPVLGRRPERSPGSSPRGRGTLPRSPGAANSQRFIPARAGNATGDRRKVGL